MKRNILDAKFKKPLLAVPAAALMLGAAQAGTTVGLNFQAWYYDSGATPQTVGFGFGYQTTGFPVTTRAFGVELADWVSTVPQDCRSAIADGTSAGSVNFSWTAPNAWQSGIGAQVAGFNPETVAPGNDEVTWGYLDDGNTTGSSPTASASGLAGTFPNGYVIQTIAANGGVKTFNDVDITDGVTTNTVAYSAYLVPDPIDSSYDGTVGLSAQSAVFTSDTININPQPKTAGNRSVLAGFIITDKPVVTKSQASLSVNQGSTLTLSAGVIGIGPISYQWQHAGTNFPGATTVPFSKTATPDDAGNWVLAATNAYGSGSSDTTAVTINQVPLIITDLASGTNTVYAGFPKTLTVIAGGASPLSYQWKSNGANIAGATNASLTVSNLTVGLSGYSVVVANAFPPAAQSATNFLNVVASPDAYTTQVGQDGPVSYWPFNEATGSTAFDYAGYGHDGTYTNNLVIGVAGPQSPAFPGFGAAKTAYLFDGATSYVVPGTAPSLSGPTDFTVEAWVNTVSTAQQAIVHQRDSAGYIGTYRVGINADGTAYFTIYGSGGFQYSFSSTIAVNDGQWHQVVAVRSGANGAIYIDGSQSAAATGALQDLDGTRSTYIGANQRDNSEYFDGKMANIAIYNKALSSGRIASHYITASGATFAVQLTPGGLIKDTKPVGTLHHGTNHGATWVDSVTDTAVVPVTRAGAELFTAASGSQIAIPADADFNSTTGTIMFWMKAAAPLPGPGTEAAMLVDRRTTNGTVIVLNDAGAIFVQCAHGANSFAVGYLPDDNWHHVAVTYDQSATGSLEIFIDGASAGSQVNTAAWSWPPSQEIELGQSHDPYWRRLDGKMDDFRIYNRVLTGSEISSVMGSDALVDTAALKVRYNFDDAAGVGQTVTWPFGTLMSSPTLSPAAWTPVTGATTPYSFLPTGPTLFFRAEY